MRTGTVKFFNESKGYGFITDSETGRDIFVHVSGLKTESLREGDKVSYVEEEGRKGKIAAQVTVIQG
jgi:CspA family cold shock protein